LERNLLSDTTDVPSEMLFALTSGLYPHISVKAAKLQVQRLEKERSLNANQTGQLLAMDEMLNEKLK